MRNIRWIVCPTNSILDNPFIITRRTRDKVSKAKIEVWFFMIRIKNFMSYQREIGNQIER